MIRAANNSDIDEIMYIISEVIKNPVKEIINMWDETYPNPDVIKSDISNGCLYVYETERMLGFIVMDENDGTNYDTVKWEYGGKNYSVIHRFAVNPSYNGQGVGKALIKHVVNIAYNNKMSAIKLDTYSKNYVSQNIYTKMGFKKVGEATGRCGIYYMFEMTPVSEI